MGSKVRFAARSRDAAAIWLCLFDETDREIERLPMAREGEVFAVEVAGVGAGARYGFRANGQWNPEAGLWFDPAKLLMDPYARRIDRQWRFDERLSVPRANAVDTAPLVPKAVVESGVVVAVDPPRFVEGGLIYELNVRGFSMLHPLVPEAERGTLAALRHPAIIEHFLKVGVDAIEMMPISAWIDEPHLARRGLTNAWGYNPANFLALDPRLAPGGFGDLAQTVAALHAAGIGVILDVVYNHTGEGDRNGPILSWRGLDNRTWYRHQQSGELVNDTGCGNTLACDRPAVRDLILESLRRFVTEAGIDGFRFDLATTLGRDEKGFGPKSGVLGAIRRDPVLRDRILIAEPWDVGPGGYRLGGFGERFLEWNDRFRDGVRRFWRGDGTRAEFATCMAGSSDVFGGVRTRSVNYVASHDGFTLADVVSYSKKHNEANGEDNRDGHDGNHSWNHGVEGPTEDARIKGRRQTDVRALLATLFVSRGTLMLAAGDQFGRTQAGNSNAYAQDNATTWLDWENRDRSLSKFAAELARLRRRFPVLGASEFFSGKPDPSTGLPDVEWRTAGGQPVSESEWQETGAADLAMILATGASNAPRLAFLFNRSDRDIVFNLPTRPHHHWRGIDLKSDDLRAGARSVAIIVEEKLDQ
jgi:glycogen operon protein